MRCWKVCINLFPKSNLFPKKLLISFSILFLGITLFPFYSLLSQSNSPDPKKIYYIGKITQNSEDSFYPLRYYLLDEESMYSGFTHRAGGINIFFSKSKPENLDSIFILEGVLTKDLTTKIKKMKKLPLEKFSSPRFSNLEPRPEWLPPENIDPKTKKPFHHTPGVTSRSILKSLSYFEVDSFQKTNLLEILPLADGNQTQITITNPLDWTLPPTTLSVSYTNPNTKPAPKYAPISIPPISKGKNFTVLVDNTYFVQYTKVSGEKFLIHSFEWVGNNQNIFIKGEYFLTETQKNTQKSE